MNTRTRKLGFAHRIGRTIRRGWDKLNQFELGVARRAGDAYPSIGFTAVRGVFLILKLAIVLAFLFISVWLVLCVLMILVPAAAIANSKQDDGRFEDFEETKGNREFWYDRYDGYGNSSDGAWDDSRYI